MAALNTMLHPRRIRRTLGAAACVHESVRFVWRELQSRPSVASYHLRGADLPVYVRHPLLDMWGLEEMFRFRVYEPPPAIEAALAELGRAPRVADLGAHVGFFALFVFALWPDASVTSVEADPRNIAVLRQCVAANGREEHWRVLEGCASTREGTVEFASSFHLSRIGSPADPEFELVRTHIASAFPFLKGSDLLSAERVEVRCFDALPVILDADLVKIDIEGAEWELLADERFAELTATALVLEYHPTYGPGEQAEPTLRAALGRAGYELMTPWRSGDASLAWACKPELLAR